MINREKLWRNFHTFRGSKDHFVLWHRFLKEPAPKAGPIFFQHITEYMHSALVKEQFPTTPVNPEAAEDVALSSNKVSALRYASGYKPRNLISKVGRSAHQNKRALQMCFMDLVEEDGMGEVVFDEAEAGQNR